MTKHSDIPIYSADRAAYLRDSHEMYVEAYDYTLDERPPLDWETWMEVYGPVVLREGIEGGLVR